MNGNGGEDGQKDPLVELSTVASPDADRRLRQALDLILRAAQRAKEGQSETENEPLKEDVQGGTND